MCNEINHSHLATFQLRVASQIGNKINEFDQTRNMPINLEQANNVFLCCVDFMNGPQAGSPPFLKDACDALAALATEIGAQRPVNGNDLKLMFDMMRPSIEDALQDETKRSLVVLSLMIVLKQIVVFFPGADGDENVRARITRTLTACQAITVNGVADFPDL